MTELKKRTRNAGLEATFLESFLNSSDFFLNDNFNCITLEEVYAEMSIPDALIVLWPKDKIVIWNMERDYLTKNDIKILHHISIHLSSGVHLNSLLEKLGFGLNSLTTSLRKLEASNLIKKRGNRFYIYKLKQNFFFT